MQFSSYQHVESFKSLGGYVRVHEINPENKKDEVPILFIPGWGASAKTVEKLAIEFANHGRRILVINNEHLDRCQRTEEKEYRKVPCLEYNKAIGIHTILKGRELTKVDLISHSEGSVAATVAMHMEPSFFRNLLLINPAGLLENDTLLKLEHRFLFAIYTHIHNSKGILHKQSITFWFNVLKYVLLNPIQSFREAFNLPYCDIESFLEEINVKQDMQALILQTKGDVVFPLKKIKKTLQRSPSVRLYVEEGNHIQLYLEPERFVVKILKILNERGK